MNGKKHSGLLTLLKTQWDSQYFLWPLTQFNVQSPCDSKMAFLGFSRVEFQSVNKPGLKAHSCNCIINANIATNVLQIDWIATYLLVRNWCWCPKKISEITVAVVVFYVRYKQAFTVNVLNSPADPSLNASVSLCAWHSGRKIITCTSDCERL